jgi:hypothetical protein
MRSITLYPVLLLGFALVLTGVILSFLMMLRIIQPTFLWVFLAYGASVAGSLLGVTGAAFIYRTRQHK